MTDTRNDTCEDRIDSYMAGRIEDLTKIIEAIDNDGGEIDGYEVDADDALERMDEFALSIDTETTMVVCIGTGGPGDQFEIKVERAQFGGYELAESSALYRFLDWGDGAVRRTSDPAVMRYLEHQVERMSY
jgi:hypothetical protein